MSAASLSSQFAFLSEWPVMLSGSVRVESAVNADPRAACVYARQALETVVKWLFDSDGDFTRPYDRTLAGLMSAPSFKQCVPAMVARKADAIRELGNRAAHEKRDVRRADAVAAVGELFHVAYWFARHYSKRWASEGAAFDPAKLPLAPADAVRQTLVQLQKAQADLEARDKQLAEERAARLKHETDGKALAEEIAQLRAEVKEAKSAAKAKAELIPDPHDYTEQQTRDLFIDLMLREAGWGVDGWTSGKDVEVPVEGLPSTPTGAGLVDYVLWGADGLPLAVVEAKRTTKDAAIGQQQAKLYADALAAQYKRRPVVFFSNGYETWMWDDAGGYPPRAVAGFYTRDELELMVLRRTARKDPAAEAINTTIVERAYQAEAIRAVGERFAAKHRRALVVMATGSGKTRTVIALADVLMRAGWVKRALFLADRRALVNQAVGAFKKHLPSAAPVNLVTDKVAESRVYVSTYPTMMGLIEAGRFGPGHFDLVVIDEAHRSVYQKYGAIFRHFDGLLLGLTATPRGEVDHDTYKLFDLTAMMPTFSYDLEEAVKQRYLVPFRAMSVPLRFQREGIKYAELPDAEKAQWEGLDWDDDGGVPAEVDAAAVNSWLFNISTVDQVLGHLMTNGIKVAGGDRLGKTIIFAKNEDHAQFIVERFDKCFPHLAGTFARRVTHEAVGAQSIIDDFATAEKVPQIAVSVDMLDTGIDVPEVVNLVFFKLVRSRTKFWQMIGRGTRLCPDLFGPGRHKDHFVVFDYCQNFEYFSEHPEGVEGTPTRSLSGRLVGRRLELAAALAGDQAAAPVRTAVLDQLHRRVAAMNVENLLVRPHRQLVERFKDRVAWDAMTADDAVVIGQSLGELPDELPPDDETAKLFDLRILQLQLSVLRGTADFERLRDQVRQIATRLTEKQAVPAVAAQLPLLLEMAGPAWWADVTVTLLEDARRAVRGLVRFLDKVDRQVVYTDLADTLGQATAVTLPAGIGEALGKADYRRQLEGFLREHEGDGAIAKLRQLEPLGPADLAELEGLLFATAGLGDRPQLEAVYGPQPDLPAFIRSIVGLDRAAASKAFSRFLDKSRYRPAQIAFVDQIIERLTVAGFLPKAGLFTVPFTDIHPQGHQGVFSPTDADAIEQVLAGFGMPPAGTA